MGHCRTFQFQLLPTVKQSARLDWMLALQCECYNAALQERRDAWMRAGVTVTYIDQCRELTELREVRPELFAMGLTVCRGTLKRLDRAYAAFFRRVRAGETPGFPRFKSRRRFDSLQWEDVSGWKIRAEAGRLHLHGLGDVKVRLHRPIRGVPKAITVKREGRRWYLSVRCVDVPANSLPATGRAIGIDLGVTELMATSDGELVSGPQFATRAAHRLAAAQRDLARKQRGSARRRRAVERVASHHRTVRNQRRDFAHQLSRRLVNEHDLIVVEDLRVNSMVRRPEPRPDGAGGYEPNGAAAKTGLNRSIHDAGWGQLLALLAYKAEDAGRELVVVDPRRTSQRCARCGFTDARNRKRAVFRCHSCGHSDHADVNAARNILGAGRALRAPARVGSN